MNFKQDCKYFLSDRPCKFHKIDNRIVCDSCEYYERSEVRRQKLGGRSQSSEDRLMTPKTVSQKLKILIIKLGAIGDVVRTTCILKPLKKKYKNSEIYWLTLDESKDVLKNNPYVTKVFTLTAERSTLNTHFDLLINLDLDKQALELTKKICAKKILGFYYDENNWIRCSNSWAKRWFELSHNDVLKKKNKMTYQKYMLGIIEAKVKSYKDYPIIINLTEEEKQFALNFAKKHNLLSKLTANRSTLNAIIGINTAGGTKWPKKEWPVKHTVELIKLIVERLELRDKKIKILIFGGKKEKRRNKKIFS